MTSVRPPLTAEDSCRIERLAKAFILTGDPLAGVAADYPEALMVYEETFIDEPTLTDKLAALDVLAASPTCRYSYADLVVAIISLLSILGWLVAIYLT